MTKYIKTDPETGRLMDLQMDEDRDWFNDHPENFIRIRFLNDGDRAGIKSIGQSFDDVNCVVVVKLKEESYFRVLCAVVPFCPIWRAMHGEPYKDEDFFPNVKRLFQQSQGKKYGAKLFRDFKRRCKRGPGIS